MVWTVICLFQNELYLPNRSELQKLVNNILEQDTKKEEKEAE